MSFEGWCTFVGLVCAHKWLYAIRYLGFQLWWLYKSVVGRSCSAVGHRNNAPKPSALPDIAATRCEVQRAVSHRNNAARSSALLAIAATLRHPARCCNSAGRTLQAAVHCQPTSQQRCELQRSRPSLQRCEELQCSAAARHRRSGNWALHVRRPSNFRPSNFRPSNFRPSNFRPTSGPASLLTSSSCVPAGVIVLPSCIMHTSLLTSLIASSYWRPVSCVLPSCRLTSCIIPYCSLAFYTLWSCILWSYVLQLILLHSAVVLSCD